MITTTPKPTRLVRDLIADPACIVTRGSTYENVANLNPVFINTVIRKYEGTRLGRQELNAEVLDDTPGALWTRKMIKYARGHDVNEPAVPADLLRVVVGVDPAGGEDEDLGTSEVGIVAVGEGRVDRRGYVVADQSLHGSPETWARVAVELYRNLNADAIVAERNFGGAMVRAVIHAVDRNVNVKLVTASRGKTVRAEPVAALYEQERISHAKPFPDLEDQMCTYVAGGDMPSPDRMDALVWALTDLMLDRAGVKVHKRHDDKPRTITIGDMVVGEEWIDEEPVRRRRR